MSCDRWRECQTGAKCLVTKGWQRVRQCHVIEGVSEGMIGGCQSVWS